MQSYSLVSAIVWASISLFPVGLHAAKGGMKGPAIQAYENANDNASFKSSAGKGNNKVSDELKKIDKDLEKGHDKSDKDELVEGKDKLNDKDTQLKKNLKGESKKAIK